jgi:hypothetical protein
VPVQAVATVPVQDLEIAVQAAARITGRVLFDGDSPPPRIDELRLVPLEEHSDLTIGTIRVRVGADGRFTTPGLLPGPYLVFAETGLRRPERPIELLWWTSSIQVDGREDHSGNIHLGARDVDVAITLTDRRAVVTGTVRGRRGELRPDARVVVFGRDPSSMEGCLRIIAPNRFGVFEHTWAVGDCLYAAVIGPPRAWRDPEYLRTLVPFAAPARVELGQARTLDLTVGP